MVLFAQCIFWICFAALAHTYVIYPKLMQYFAKGKSKNDMRFNTQVEKEDLPFVSVLMSVFNEEKVLLEKLKSLAALDYPTDKLTIYLGSDASDDSSHTIIQDFIQSYRNFRFFPFQKRRGKPPVINDLAIEATKETPVSEQHLFLMTDASVMMEKDALLQLAQHFKNRKIGVVDAHIQPIGQRSKGISQSESQYLNQETALKDAESRAWGMMIGPFGGCYALRSDLFQPVPANYLVDDFYITFRVLENGYQAINELDAQCFEGATHAISDEYRRKKRIAAGSFQNLFTFRKWVLPPTSRLGFAFFSHKVLRWFGGFFLLFLLLTAAYLAFHGKMIYQAFLGCSVLVGVIIPALHALLKKLNIESGFLKNITYFIAMNIALSAGFFQFLSGIKSNIWQPTKRY